jgi:hypothetical protein
MSDYDSDDDNLYKCECGRKATCHFCDKDFCYKNHGSICCSSSNNFPSTIGTCENCEHEGHFYRCGECSPGLNEEEKEENG